MKLKNILQWFKIKPPMKIYIATLTNVTGWVGDVTIQATNRHEADQKAQVFERNGIHVTCVQPYEWHMQDQSEWMDFLS